jgi:glyoxylase-like metal-dependent hydrolase (beta-lactamase superfamily II)
VGALEARPQPAARGERRPDLAHRACVENDRGRSSVTVRVEVLTSGIWQTTSTIVESGGACVVIDPAYFPRELEAIAARVGELGRAEAVVFTHGHWDHVMGHTALPGAPVWLSQTLDRLISDGDPRAEKYLDGARELDSRWYVPRPHGHRWPDQRRGLVDGETIEIGGAPLRVLHLPGHSPDGLGILVGETLLVGDYLSPCEIPFVDDIDAYLATLSRLAGLIANVRDVIPGHGHTLAARDAMLILNQDAAYLEQLVLARDRSVAHHIQLPRAADVSGMRDHHLENCAKVGLA